MAGEGRGSRGRTGVSILSRADDLVKLGCIVCRVYYHTYSPPCIHHLLGIKYRAMGKKAADKDSIPLCPHHHQYGTKEHPAVHSHPELFEERFGTQEELLEMTNKLLGVMNEHE